ncbi:MAG: PIG-L family deacetylase [Candidatus Latescibacterota bacterium]|nr:MAG: PIG-L family deacetylase [Candidatus Latescibacterota bacterium]
MKNRENGRPTLLCVFAHPDDETYGPGGTIARAALEGARVRLLLFTCGEAGTVGVSKTLSREELCRRRRLEAARASEALGIAEHRILGLPDRRLSATPLEDGTRLVLEEMLAVRPDVVLTFHRLGVSGHPDHLAVTSFTAEAFRRSGDDGPRKLYEWGIPRSKTPLYRERRIVPIEDGDVTTIVRVPGEAMERKIEAIRRHETQIEIYHELARTTGDFRAATSEEFFVLSESRVPPAGAIETDLFQGLGAS